MESGRSCGRSQTDSRGLWTGELFIVVAPLPISLLQTLPHSQGILRTQLARLAGTTVCFGQNSCRQESKKAPLTEGINPRKVYTLSWTLSWGCFFFLASMISCTKKKRYLIVTVQMFLPLRDGRWFDHETRSRWYTHLTKRRFRV